MNKTLDFLKKLKNHNDREWFEKNKGKYLESKEEYEAFIEKMIAGIRKFDKKIGGDLTAKDCTFRIYRDVRFSKNKKPYKTNMGASIDPGGKKSQIAGYYIHVEPGNCFVAGGVWMPEPAMLQSIRQEIDYNPEPLLKILKSSSFKKFYQGLDSEDQLKTVPKGFPKDHPQIELLKNRHFLVSHPFTDREVLSKNAVQKMTEACKAMHPFLLYIREAQGHGA
jgi:uncharacterized protein (TIGR02453 family)